MALQWLAITIWTKYKLLTIAFKLSSTKPHPITILMCYFSCPLSHIPLLQPGLCLRFQDPFPDVCPQASK